jgi:hypothetical protein
MEIIGFLRSKPASEQARLLGTMTRHITNTGLINIMQNYDINNKQKDVILKMQLQSFATVPGLSTELRVWLSS